MQKFPRKDKNDTKVEDLLTSATSKLKGMVDANVVVGDAIESENVKIIPLSKVSVGFVAGGGEYDKQKQDEDFPFAGGSGAGYSVQPVGYLVICDKEVSFTKIIPEGPLEKAFDVLPLIVDKINDKIKK